jgi:hypothetical protein
MRSEQHSGNDTDRPGEKPVPTTLPIANLTLNGPGLKPGHCGEKPATNRLDNATFDTHLHFKSIYVQLHSPLNTEYNLSHYKNQPGRL